MPFYKNPPLPLNDAIEKPALFTFVSFIRFISMIGIVWAHTDGFPVVQDTFAFLKRTGDVEIYIAFKQIFKFSLISFFLISGFLIGENMQNTNPVSYFKRRVKSTLNTFLFAFGLFVILSIIKDYILKGVWVSISQIPRYIYYTFFFTPYWFLPMYYLGLFLMLAFNKFSDSWKFGLCLLIINLIYTYNQTIALTSLNKDHTSAILAFIFYLWLGAYIRKKNLIDKFKQINCWFLIPAILITYGLSCYQSVDLFNKGSQFFFNNLRIFNQLYGILVFLFLVKICPYKPNFGKLDPRKETFGIFMYHFYFVAFIYPVLVYLSGRYLNFYIEGQPMYVIVILSFIHFATAYIFAVSIVRFFIRRNWPIT